ncbi:coiled-coil domain-containing protein 89 isoform X1 [Mugil cephalus]|uniref:coiled-coil domain-containing protein 89 isoform X1 n=1 Tax=Mugil cephalus TaxID=48193 RepID=UPI001FB693CD|nr:coiled-coil domain-containing protein 89 isoform X1 [Mugil cephalus]
MVTPQSNVEDVLKVEGSAVEHKDSIQKSLQNIATDDTTERILRSRIDEQSSLICILKQRADEMLLRCQALQKINKELEDQVTDCQNELNTERRKSDMLEKRFMDLAANNQAIIVFMEEYKNQNAQFVLENKRLRAENESLFSKKLQDKEVMVCKLKQEIKLLTETHTHKENEYREKLAESESVLLEQATQHKVNETSLHDQLHDAHQQHREVLERCEDLKLKLQETKEQLALKETSMRESSTSFTKEKDKLLCIAMERGKVIQEKNAEIQQLKIKWKEEKQARVKAQDRFELESEAVNADLKVKSLQSALNESMAKFEKLNMDLEAFKEHSTNLLKQERELNKKLRHMTG